MAPFSARQHIICLARYMLSSVYLSVCLSVTRVDQSKWLKLGLRNFKHTIPLVFASYKFHPEILMGSPDLAVRQGKVWKQAIGDIGFNSILLWLRV